MLMSRALIISKLSEELHSKNDEIKKLQKELYGPLAVAAWKHKARENAGADLVPMSPGPGLDHSIPPKTEEEAMLMSRALIISKLLEELHSKNDEIKQLQKELYGPLAVAVWKHKARENAGAAVEHAKR